MAKGTNKKRTIGSLISLCSFYYHQELLAAEEVRPKSTGSKNPFYKNLLLITNFITVWLRITIAILIHGDSVHIFLNMEAEQFTYIAQKKEIALIHI